MYLTRKRKNILNRDPILEDKRYYYRPDSTKPVIWSTKLNQRSNLTPERAAALESDFKKRDGGGFIYEIIDTPRDNIELFNQQMNELLKKDRDNERRTN